jgi:hypothetical protein
LGGEMENDVGLGLGSGLFIGVAGVGGIEAAFKPIPLDLTVEYRPVLGVVNGLVFDLMNFSAHVRYWF